jgi:hypothetical protein
MYSWFSPAATLTLTEQCYVKLEQLEERRKHKLDCFCSGVDDEGRQNCVATGRSRDSVLTQPNSAQNQL